MSKSGRPSLFEERIKSKYELIEKLIKQGATEKQVAEACGVSYRTWNYNKARNPEFKAFIQGIDRRDIVEELRGALIKKAIGFRYEESKTITRPNEDGDPVTITEVYSRYALPDVAAINLALKNYDKKNWANDPQALELRKREIDLRERIYEESKW